MLTAVKEVRSWKGWVMASELEQYLDKFDEVDRLAGLVFALGEKISAMGKELKESPQSAAGLIPSDWPTAQHILELLMALESERNNLNQEWGKLSARIRETIPHKQPSGAGQYRKRIPN